MSGIYVASKTRHAEMWKRYRGGGFPIISTWIDEAGEGESECLTDLWKRCIKESAECSALVAYAEAGDVWKGAFIEIGSALASGKIVFAVGCDPRLSFLNHPNVRYVATVGEALKQAVILSPLPTVEGDHNV